MTPGSPAERRQHRRLLAQIPARFGIEGRMCDGAIIDISEGGVQIRSSEPFAAGVVVDVFVQFPGRRLRLRARVAWVRGEPPTMGLSFVQPDRSLIAAYDHFMEETRGRTGVAPLDRNGAAEPAPASARPAAPAAPLPEPAGPVIRHLETARGNEYDIRVEKGPAGWRLLVYASPRPSPAAGPDLDRLFRDFASADAALRKFLETR
jgi:hypothetical protein